MLSKKKGGNKMKLSKTAIKELRARYLLILKKCAYLNAIFAVSMFTSISSLAETPIDTAAELKSSLKKDTQSSVIRAYNASTSTVSYTASDMSTYDMDGNLEDGILTFATNTSEPDKGGRIVGVYLTLGPARAKFKFSSDDVTLRFIGNKARSGGALHTNHGYFTFDSDVIFESNITKQYGGAITNASSGAKLTFASSGDAENLNQATFISNQVVNTSYEVSGGGAISNDKTFTANDILIFGDKEDATKGNKVVIQVNDDNASSTMTGMGGAFFNNTGTATFNGSTLFANNSVTIEKTTSGLDSILDTFSANGGAFYNKATATFNGDTEFYANQAEDDGGALFNDSTITFAGITEFYGNQAEGNGGALYNDSTITFNGKTTFSNNTAYSFGGAIFNTGTITFNAGNLLSFSGNTAYTAGSAIFNDGTITIKSANDTLSSQSMMQGLSNTSSRLFADGETIYNMGELIFTDSSVQLYDSTEPTKTIFNSSNEKVGTLTLNNSRIDIGKSTLYSDIVNFNENSQLITHVNGKTGLEAGKISANTISISETGTDLAIVLAPDEHFAYGGRIFKILESDDISGEFATLTNAMYKIEYLGNGEYKLCADESCTILEPGEEPTEEPSTEPGEEPTEEPSTEPSEEPSEEPSTEPSEEPSEEPSTEPSEEPSEEPSTEPSEEPSEEPSTEPSEEPSEEPSTEPSEEPSEEPSTEPSEEPSTEPDGDDQIKDPTDDNITTSPTIDCEGEECIHDAWIFGGEITENEKAIEIQNTLSENAQLLGPNSKEYRDALNGLAPDTSSLIQSHTEEIITRLSNITSKHMYAAMERTGYVHNGKRFYKFPRKQANLWVQGILGQSENTGKKGFDMDTEGIALGFENNISPDTRLGIAYSYSTTEGESVQRDTEISSHALMVYGSYNPNRFYMNWQALYAHSTYEEDKKVFHHHVSAEYDVDVFSGQILVGRKVGPFVTTDWATGVISTEAGLRYTYINRGSYTDEVGQQVDSSTGHVLTGILGARYSVGYTLSPTMSFYPELKAGITYDFVEADLENSVTLLNGSKYKVKNENMDRFGVEIGARVGLDINKRTELSLEYDGLFKGDYKNHTGLASMKYKF